MAALAPDDPAENDRLRSEPMMNRIAAGIGLRERGDRAAARAVFAEIWPQIGPAGDALERCALAHSMADVQDDPTQELQWDLLALDAADAIDAHRLRAAGVVVTVRGLYPSLHLNLGDVYRRLGEPEKAREHVERGRRSLDALPRDGYRAMIEAGFDRLASRIGSTPTG